MPKACVQKPRIKLYQGDVNISKKVIRINNINTYQKDHKEYRGLILENGIKVILISDSYLKMAARASVGLNIGSMMDPEDLPGLAHLVEHCLFNGTEKYPETCGLNFEAYTKMDTTVYNFYCHPYKLNENLDKLAQFFIAPLFEYGSIKREISNIAKECGLYEKDDSWKIVRLASYLTRPHPYSKYSCGNRTIFEDIPRRMGINLRDEILKFYKKWYSANLMSLVVHGRDSLDELEKMVVPKYSKIPNYKTEVPIWQKPLFHKEICTSKVYIIPHEDIKTMVVNFNIDDVNSCYKVKPALYLEYLLNRRGQGSLLYELKSRSLCINLRADAITFCRGNGLLVITIKLTDNGLDNVDEILKYIFQYFNYVKEEGIQKWLFEQQSNLRKLYFLLQSLYTHSVPTHEIAESLLVNPMEDVLTAPVLISNWCPDLIIKLLDELEPKNCVIFIESKTFDNDTTVTYETEPWFKIKYYKEKVPFDTLKKWEYARYSRNMFQLPAPIPFLPTNFDILPLDKNITKFPTIIHNSDVLKVWHKQEAIIFEPRIFINLNILNPISNIDPLNCILMDLFIFALDTEIFHMEDAHLVNMIIRINDLYKGLNITIIGFSHKCEIFFKLFLDYVFNFKIDSTMFDRVKYKYRKYMNDLMDIEHGLNTLHVIITENQSSFMDNFMAMEYATFEKFQQFINEFFSRVFIEAFIYGNTNMQKSLEYVEILKEKLKETDSITVPISQYQLMQRRDHKINNDKGQIYIIKIEQTICVGPYVAIYLQCGLKSDKNSVITSMISDIINRQIIFTNILKDLGFQLFCYSRTHNNTNGFILFATLQQPVKYRMSTVQKLIEDFLDKMQKKITTLSNQEFQAYKNYQANQINNFDDMDQYQIFESYCHEINNRGYYFEDNANQVAALIKLTKADIVRFYKKYVVKNAPTRRVLIIQSDSKECYSDEMLSNNCVCDCQQECNQFEDSPQEMKTDSEGSENFIEIHDIAAFKASMEFYPLK